MRRYEQNDAFWLRFSRRSGWESIRVDDYSPSQIVVIDLSYTNSQLKEQFGAFLRALRTEPSRNPDTSSSHDPDFKFWAKGGLLPCMDLLLWAEEQRRRVTNTLLADAVPCDDDEPDAVIDPDTIRKTIRPLAAEMLYGPASPSGSYARLQVLAVNAKTLKRKAKKK